MSSSGASSVTGAATAAIVTGTVVNPLVYLDTCERLPVQIQKLAKSHSSHANGSKYQVNSNEAKCLENKLCYQVPTALGPIKIKTSQVKRAERSSQVKASQASGASLSVHNRSSLI